MIKSDKNNVIYCLQRLECGRYLKLNRAYQPLGNASDAWVDYERFEGEALPITPHSAARISWNGDTNTDMVFLFNDGSAPWLNERSATDYAHRLDGLRTLT